MLIVHNGSTNPQKSYGAQDALREMGVEALVVSEDVESGITDQPMDLETICRGAMNRARAALATCSRTADFFTRIESEDFHLGAGFESGLFRPGPPQMGWMDIGVCALYASHGPGEDGERWAFGLSEGFAIPKAIEKVMREEGADLSTAARLAGYTDHAKIGEAGGIVSILSDGRVLRRAQIASAYRMALIRLDALMRR